jgi:hypothetical protein
MKLKLFLSAIILSFPILTFAQLEGNPENLCRNGLFPRDSKTYSIGNIKAKKGERVYFYGDDENCPNGKNCRQKSYLVNNDEVLVSRTYGKYVCAWYQPKKGYETVGWLPKDKLEFMPMVQGIESYVGNWSFYDSDIEIKKTKDSKIFDVKGNAFWKGINNNVNIGELDDKAKWNGDVLLYGEDDNDEYACKVKLKLAGKYLVVSDNLQCGGMNVTFSGVYLKSISKK